MLAKIINISDNKIKIEVEIKLEKSFLKTEEDIQMALNQVGCLATGHAIKQYDTDGSAIEIKRDKLSCKGLVSKKYQTPYGEIKIERNVYQNNKGGKTYCPLEAGAKIIKSTTPRFAKMISSKYSENNSKKVQDDLKNNHCRYISKSFIQDISNSVGSIILSKEDNWNYRLPADSRSVKVVGCGLDGTCLLMGDDGYRETMVGTIAFYNEGCERLNTIYLAAAPEYGKQDFILRYEAELRKVKKAYPDSTYVGIADGAKDNWTFLKKHTDVQVLDYYHASEYVTTVSNSIFRSEDKRKMWLADSCHKLMHEEGGAKELLNEFQRFKSEKKLGKNKMANLQKAITYFANNTKRMSYSEYKNLNYPIGSGVTEAACKVIVKQRLGNSGMKWKHNGAQNVLALRAMNYSDDRWIQMWEKIDRYGI